MPGAGPETPLALRRNEEFGEEKKRTELRARDRKGVKQRNREGKRERGRERGRQAAFIFLLPESMCT